MLKCVIVGDDDLRPPDLRQHLRRRDLAGLIVVVRLARQQYAKPILDRDARSDDQEGAGKIFGVLPRGVDRLPGDQHGHDRRLAAPGRHLQGQAEKFGIGLLVGFGDLIQKTLRRRTLRRDLRQPDNRLDGFDLAEEGLRSHKFVIAPVLQEPLGDCGHAPVSRISHTPPPIEVAADLVDQRVLGVGLQIEGPLRRGRLLPRGRNRDNKSRRAAALPRLPLERLAVWVEWMMELWRSVGRVQNRPLIETLQWSSRPQLAYCA